MAARPLQLYVLCIFICGHQFYLVLQLATHMTTYQLGYDRSACLRDIRTIRLDILSCWYRWRYTFEEDWALPYGLLCLY
ncbi:uncharacterized protein F5891DRAFT_1020511 [Suillus fuscotomentosus]|uniref:Uncharacterized protein n=1 Tax=Suillus fuscotomentosus TaxID=1912939 RepID=A0AAD4HNH1_9AGAM|nr:uncharacterized protein F5891DRAFT_1020511 [Suillus fuscotomentosus]KAG1903103.1 hypothetical protein F5891DRAFT_1020511 [Suillus fuscotomentosus]